MLASDVEAEKTAILENMAEIGEKYGNMLAIDYRYDPNHPSNEVVRAAVAGMVFEKVGSFARQMMVRVMGREGVFDDAVYLLLLLDSTERPNFNYPFKNFAEYGGRAHALDSDEKVREAAIEAIGKIISKGSGQQGMAPVNGNLGKSLMRCALLDGSEKVRGLAAEIVWNYADKTVILMLLKEFSDAEMNGNLHIYTRAEDAVKSAVGAMKKTRVRGTAVKPLIEFALGDGKTGMVVSDILVRLAGMESEVAAWLKKERAAAKTSPNLEAEEKHKRIRRLTALIDRIGVVSGNEEIPPPQQLKGEPYVKPTRNMRPVTVAPKGEDDEPIRVPGGPVTEFFRRVGDRIKGRPVKK